MWPHWPHDLWCHVCWSGVFLSLPYFVWTSTYGSGPRWTIHSPLASSSNAIARRSSGASSGERLNSPFAVGAAGPFTGMLIGIGISASERVAGLLELLLHHVHEDHVEALVQRLDHVQHAGQMPDQVELGQGLVVHFPGRRGRVHGLWRHRPPPDFQVVRRFFRRWTPVREGVRADHVGRDLGAGGHDLVNDAAVSLQG